MKFATHARQAAGHRSRARPGEPIAPRGDRQRGGTPHDVLTTTYLSGHKMRTESGTTATIIDADAGRFTTIDNKAKTYSSFTFDEMAEAMQRAQESAKAEAAKEKSNPKAAKNNSKDPKGDVYRLAELPFVAALRPVHPAWLRVGSATLMLMRKPPVFPVGPCVEPGETGLLLRVGRAWGDERFVGWRWRL